MMTTMRTTILLLLLSAPFALADSPKPPAQPEKGPGGREYVYEKVQATRYLEDEHQYWIFEPSPKPAKTLPLIVFNHGWGAMTPAGYGAWIVHTVRRGHVVVYPRYQRSMMTLPGEMSPAAVVALKDAVGKLDGTQHTRIRRDKMMLMGHSLGGLISANIARRAAAEGLPRPAAIFSVQPGDAKGERGIRRMLPSMLENYSTIPADALMVALTGADDTVVSPKTAQRILTGATAVPAANKAWYLMKTDRHGSPALRASHQQPAAYSQEMGELGPKGTFVIERYHPDTCDAYDFCGSWRLADALADAVFRDGPREAVFGDKARAMGRWSDGTPVTPLVRKDLPASKQAKQPVKKPAIPNDGKEYY